MKFAFGFLLKLLLTFKRRKLGARIDDLFIDKNQSTIFEYIDNISIKFKGTIMRISKTAITIRQLTKDTIPSKENLLRMTELIYTTDPYIYPAMFGDMERAEFLLPEMIRKDDIMFGYSHCLVAEYEGNVIGTLLWIEGNIVWTPELLRQIAKEKGIEESKWLDYVAKEYTGMYSEDRDHTLSFYNMCVHPEYRGNGIGRMLFDKILETYPDHYMKLSVLDGNSIAINLYLSVGFTIVKKYAGFSVEKLKPVSILLGRK